MLDRGSIRTHLALVIGLATAVVVGRPTTTYADTTCSYHPGYYANGGTGSVILWPVSSVNPILSRLISDTGGQFGHVQVITSDDGSQLAESSADVSTLQKGHCAVPIDPWSLKNMSPGVRYHSAADDGNGGVLILPDAGTSCSYTYDYYHVQGLANDLGGMGVCSEFAANACGVPSATASIATQNAATDLYWQVYDNIHGSIGFWSGFGLWLFCGGVSAEQESDRGAMQVLNEVFWGAGGQNYNYHAGTQWPNPAAYAAYNWPQSVNPGPTPDGIYYAYLQSGRSPQSANWVPAGYTCTCTAECSGVACGADDGCGGTCDESEGCDPNACQYNCSDYAGYGCGPGVCCNFGGWECDAAGSCLVQTGCTPGGGCSYYDCAGTCNGSAVIDACGVCGGDGSSCPPACTYNCSDYASYGCGPGVCCNFGGWECDAAGSCLVNTGCTAGGGCSWYDCQGTCNGSVQNDACGVCGGDGSSCTCGAVGGNTCNSAALCSGYALLPSSDCSICCYVPPAGCDWYDCQGTCNGNVWNDACGVCGGDGSSCQGCSWYDCQGTCNGGVWNDSCGVCGGDGSSCACSWYDCQGTCNGGVWNDACGVCGGDGSSCQPPACDWYDCQGTCNGGVWNDACGVCGGDGSSCAPPSCDWYDCQGTCNGGVWNDSCGVCGGDGSSCACSWYDCQGTCNGGVWNDACGVCGGDGSSCAPPSCDWYDCQGTCNGGVWNDACGVCGGDGSSCAPPSCNWYDCQGTCNGGVWNDSCGVCGGDGSSCACSWYDCQGTCNGGVWNDSCGVCGGDGSSCAPPACDWYDCQGTCNGGVWNDSCGVCGGDGSSCAPPACDWYDCQGTCNGGVWNDSCGVCGGDGSSCYYE